MTRRQFFCRLMQFVTTVYAGGLAFTRRPRRHRFLLAEGAETYPGKVSPLGNIRGPSRWSG